MNPVFWFLVALGAFILWVGISFIFIPLGKFIIHRIKKMNDIFEYKDEEDDN